MKTQKLVLTAILLLFSCGSLWAPNAPLPDPHNDSCWSNLSAQRACQIQTYNEGRAQAQDCTSYPEYQCFDYYQPPQKTAVKSTPKTKANPISPSAHASRTPASVPVSMALSGKN